MISPGQRTQYLKLVRRLLDRVPEGYTISVEQQNGCEWDGETTVSWGAKTRQAHAYRQTPDAALVFILPPADKTPTIPRLVPG